MTGADAQVDPNNAAWDIGSLSVPPFFRSVTAAVSSLPSIHPMAPTGSLETS
jgi:hypothetical protein